MSTQVTIPEAAPAFDAKAHIEARMSGKPAPNQQKADRPAEEPKTEVAATAPEPERKSDTTRSQRRALRAAEARTASLVLKVLGESGVLPKKTDEKAEDTPAEPKRADFPAGEEGTAQFLRATQKFDKEQEASQITRQEELKAQLAERDAKVAKDIAENYPDWDKLAKDWAANEDLQEIKYADIPTVIGLLVESDMRAAIQYHWMQHPEQFIELTELTPSKQIVAFHRLEGRLEKAYDGKQKAAQAAEPEKAQEDRKHLAEAQPEKAKPGEPATGGQPVKPRPSSEIVARGGSPPSEQPVPGSAAWIAMRIQKLYGR